MGEKTVFLEVLHLLLKFGENRFVIKNSFSRDRVDNPCIENSLIRCVSMFKTPLYQCIKIKGNCIHTNVFNQLKKFIIKIQVLYVMVCVTKIK